MPACLCNICHLFHCSQVTPSIAWCSFTPRPLDAIFANKIECFIDCDGDRQIGFESIIMILKLCKGRNQKYFHNPNFEISFHPNFIASEREKRFFDIFQAHVTWLRIGIVITGKRYQLLATWKSREKFPLKSNFLLWKKKRTIKFIVWEWKRLNTFPFDLYDITITLHTTQWQGSII